MYERFFRVALVTSLLTCMIAGQAVAQQSLQQPRMIKRARRPVFTERDWDGIYFDDLFSEGLVGNRPESLEAPASNQPSGVGATSETAGADAAGGWSHFISAAVIEDEIKSLQVELDGLVTTPTRFKTENAQVRHNLNQLATWFGIISQYDQRVRWKEYSAQARYAFARAAAGARTTTDQAYNAAKQQKDNLEELVRGGKFPGGESDDQATWSDWADRSEMMDRIDLAFTEHLKPWTSNEAEFKDHLDEILHESSIIAALGNVLTQKNMENADDTEYTKHASQMFNAAIQLTRSASSQDYTNVAGEVDTISKACSNCHEAYR